MDSNIDLSGTDIDREVIEKRTRVILKEILMKRALVSGIIHGVIQNLTDRCACHGNEATEEVPLYAKAITELTEDDHTRKIYQRLYDRSSVRNSDYNPENHPNKFVGMDMIQLIEYLADRMIDIEQRNSTRYDAAYMYMLRMPELEETTSEVRSICSNTIETLIKLRERRTKWTDAFTAIAEKVKPKEEDAEN